MNPNTIRITAHFRRVSDTLESNTQEAFMTSLDIVISRREELETVVAWAGLGVEEVPLLALRIEGYIRLAVVRLEGIVRVAAELSLYI